jgi:nucleotide-binding universal stress UspA family protein
VAAAHHTVLVPLTDPVETEQLMRTACTVAEEDASVTAVVVIEISPLLPLDARMDEEEARARRLLSRARAAGEDYGVRVVPRVVRARAAAPAILELAVQEDAELVVVGSGRHRLRKLERQVLRNAPCRVLVVAPSAPG